MKNLNIIFFLLTFISCKNSDSYLKYALEAAKDNRPELEKVLNHYKEDPLKYKAAVFLIENMPGHFSYAGDGIRQYYEICEKILVSDLPPGEQRDTIVKIAEQFPGLKENIISDIKIMKADYLIKNIDDAFKLWETKPWAQFLNFEQFCEYLLPYKCCELQELDHWRDTMSAHFSDDLSAMPHDDDHYDSPYNATTKVRNELLRKVKPYGIWIESGYPFLSASTMCKITFGKCSDYVNLGVATMRSLGIPVVIENTPAWGRYRAGHEWYTLLNDKGELLLSQWDISSDPGSTFFPYSRIPKVYRHMYAINRETLEYMNKAKYSDPSNSILHKDVTGEYFATNDPVIPVIRNDLEDRYAYIAHFNGHYTDWLILDFGILKKKKAHFKNMGRNVLYLAFGYDGSGLVPISKPFIIHRNGNIEYIEADKKNFQQVVLRRKYHANENVVSMQHRALHGMIQASDHSGFSGCDTLFTIENFEYPDKIPLNPKKPYRYYRYMSPKGSYGSIAEIKFFKNDGEKEMTGKIISSVGSNKKVVNKAFDNDWLTNFETDSADGNWIGMDFGKPVLVDKVRCIPRNDDNNIHIGNEYELKYWDTDDWKSMGKKIAYDNYLVYDSIPLGALLWLDNHSGGWDERVFLYKDGKQEWW